MKKALGLFFWLLILYFTLEILVRRWVWGQVPTQVATWIVYATVALNGVVLWRYRHQLLSALSGHSKKTGKN